MPLLECHPSLCPQVQLDIEQNRRCSCHKTSMLLRNRSSYHLPQSLHKEREGGREIEGEEDEEDVEADTHWS